MGVHRGFMEEGVKTYQMAPMSPLDSPFFFVCTSIVYTGDLCAATPMVEPASSQLELDDCFDGPQFDAALSNFETIDLL